MKFRAPKTGEVFEDIHKVYSEFCNGRDCDTECPLDAYKECYIWAGTHPAEAARLMGMEAIIDKEEPMEKKDKPLGEWTLRELQTYCRKTDCDRCIFPSGHPEITGCAMAGNPTVWALDDKPRFTQEEVAVLRYFADHLHIVYLARRNDGGLFGGERPFQPNGDGFTSDGPIIGLPRTIFPSLPPGQAVKLEEIVG